MKFSSTIKEFIELEELKPSFCEVFNEQVENSLSIVWFKNDNNVFLIDGQNQIFSKNQILFLTEFHKVQAIQKSAINFIRFNRSFYCVIDHDDEVSCKGMLFFGASQLPVIQIPDESIEHFEILWKMFSIEMKLMDNLQTSMLQMMLKRYLILCVRLYKGQNNYLKDIKSTNIIREFNFLVEQHFRTLHKVSDYASLLNKAPKTLSNIFFKHNSKPPTQFIQDRIMLEAKRLLFYSDKSIKEIGYEVGFDDVQTFSRFFKTQHGISPSLFREKRNSGSIANS